MDLYDFLKLAQQYNDMGWAVQAQLKAAEECGGFGYSDTNPNAVEVMLPLLKALVAADVDDAQASLDDAQQFLVAS